MSPSLCRLQGYVCSLPFDARMSCTLEKMLSWTLSVFLHSYDRIPRDDLTCLTHGFDDVERWLTS